jgi:hypothetical protein
MIMQEKTDLHVLRRSFLDAQDQVTKRFNDFRELFVHKYNSWVASEQDDGFGFFRFIPQALNPNTTQFKILKDDEHSYLKVNVGESVFPVILDYGYLWFVLSHSGMIHVYLNPPTVFCEKFTEVSSERVELVYDRLESDFEYLGVIDPSDFRRDDFKDLLCVYLERITELITVDKISASSLNILLNPPTPTP